MITAKQYDILLTKLIIIENKQEVISSKQDQILATLEALNAKTIVISDVNEQIEQLQKDVKSLQDEGEM